MFVNEPNHHYHFESVLSSHEGEMWGNHFNIEPALIPKLKSSGVKRWLCSVNESEPLHSGLMGNGEGGYFILLNKSFCKRHHLREGDVLKIHLEPDQSEYGMPVSDEFIEVFNQTEGAWKYFDALTPGKQRNLIYFVGNVKSSDIKIRRALVVCNHLLENQGTIDFKALNSEIKAANRAAKMG
jgi:hypothetical protein